MSYSRTILCMKKKWRWILKQNLNKLMCSMNLKVFVLYKRAPPSISRYACRQIIKRLKIWGSKGRVYLVEIFLAKAGFFLCVEFLVTMERKWAFKRMSISIKLRLRFSYCDGFVAASCKRYYVYASIIGEIGDGGYYIRRLRRQNSQMIRRTSANISRSKHLSF